MKKVLLALSVLVGFGAAAQNQSSNDSRIPASAKITAKLQAEQAKKQALNLKAKAAGGIISQRMSHTDVAVDQFGTLLSNYIAPIFQDSTVSQDFGTPAPISRYAYGATFDLTSPVFSLIGQDLFDAGDTYYIDTVYVGGIYDMVNPTSANDSLIVDVVFGDPAGANFVDNWGFPANTWTNQPTRANFLAMDWTGNPAQGFQGNVNAGNSITVKKGLVANDTNNVYHKFAMPAAVKINPGQAFGFLVRYKSGETFLPGAIYFSGSGGTTTATMNSFRVLTSGSASSSDDNAYFFEEFSLGTPSNGFSGPQLSTSRYDITRPTSHSPQGGSGAYFDVWAHGNSTFELNENTNNNVKIYPNPTTGSVNLALAQGGNYQIEVVNMIGQVVYSETVSINGNETLNRDFSELNKGIYLVNVSSDNFSNTTKLTIQ